MTYPTRIVRFKQMQGEFGLGSPNTIRKLIRDGLLPPPFSIGSHAVGWLREDVEAAIAAMATRRSWARVPADATT
ncbi:AlpA family transcriptional regulator [Cupriavidus sp. SK-4]|uniref:helix-turn-helix transcriptional regulator n=1 Tax=Cupriavidus sp. SK-4 TaxID=574750 RepID=UPI000450B880|nr:AlpA family phage regulatory protein [Cupriavidus sp. SK-4]EYS86159.1 AlpA family transcriptional regulator [Cupriavidus sp. SK-4]